MSHENSITVQVGDRWVNLRTVGAGGKSISREEAMQMFRDGKMNALGNKTFSSRAAAVRAAASRSESTRTPRRNPFREM